MINLFSTANNNEEYKKVVSARMNLAIIFFLLGVIWLVVAVLAIYVWKVSTIYGVYISIGSWLTGTSAIIWIRYKLILADPEKLKNERLNYVDERNKEIRNKAFRVTAIVWLIILYAAGLIGGLFNPTLLIFLLVFHCAFPLSMLVTYKIYQNRM